MWGSLYLLILRSEWWHLLPQIEKSDAYPEYDTEDVFTNKLLFNYLLVEVRVLLILANGLS